ncbi:MAG: hypothetical protein U0Z44_20385 [Kouleothrix sp.]
MNMGDVFAIFGTLLAVGMALPGLLLGLSLLLPAHVGRAQLRLAATPWRCLLAGGALLLAGGLPIVGLLNLPAGGLKLIGWAGLALLLACTSVGAAGLAALMGERLRSAGGAMPPHGALLRGAITLELAAAFPVVGWFVIVPLAALAALGAAGLALLRRTPGRAEAAPAGAALPHA